MVEAKYDCILPVFDKAIYHFRSIANNYDCQIFK
ncbi:MAG: hypothetical protein ACJAXX_001804, partial [Roseivirga sp.]